MSATVHPPSWPEYLDALESAVLVARESMLEGRTPVLPTIAQPSGPPADDVEARRAEVARLVDDVTAFLVQHQDAVRERLEALPHPGRRPPGRPDQSLGGQLDING